MADYTIEELESMLVEKQVEMAESGSVIPDIQLYENDINNASDREKEKHIQTHNGVDLCVGITFKSRSEDKKIVYQKYYIKETTLEGNFTAFAGNKKTATTGSYSSVLTEPSVQIVRTRVKDTKILKG